MLCQYVCLFCSLLFWPNEHFPAFSWCFSIFYQACMNRTINSMLFFLLFPSWQIVPFEQFNTILNSANTKVLLVALAHSWSFEAASLKMSYCLVSIKKKSQNGSRGFSIATDAHAIRNAKSGSRVDGRYDVPFLPICIIWVLLVPTKFHFVFVYDDLIGWFFHRCHTPWSKRTALSNIEKAGM